MRRRVLQKRAGVACLAAGAVILAQPVVGMTASAPQNGTGTSSVVVSLPQATVTDPTGASHSVNLGSLTVSAASAPKLLSSLGFSGAAALGQAVPGKAMDSSQGTVSGSVTVPVSAGPVTGSVNLASYLLQSASGTATGQLSALTGGLNVAPLSLTTTLGQHGLSSQVSPTQAVSSLGVNSPAVSLKLSDLLPANVLNGLPLGEILALISSLHLNVGATLQSEISQVQATLTTLQQLSTDTAQLSSAESQLNSLIASNTQIQQAQAAVTSNQTALTTAQNALSAAQNTLSVDQTAAQTACAGPLNGTPGCTTAQQLVATQQATVTTDQANVTSAQNQLATDQATLNSLLNASPGSTLATVQAQVNSLTTTINGLLSTLSGQLGSLPDLTSLVKNLVAALGNAPLVSLGSVGMTITSTANSLSGSSSVTCTPGGLTVLGSTLPVPDCQTLSNLLASVSSQVAGALAVLPAAVRPSVTLSGLAPTSTGTSAPNAKGVTSSSAGLSPLHLAIGAISLKGLADQLTSQLEGALSQVQAVNSLMVRAPRLAARAHAVTVPAGLSALVSSVQTQLQALPTGSALAGLSTVGLDTTMVGIGTQSSFQPLPATAAPSSAPTPGASGGTGSPVAPGSLPHTGSNSLADLAAGLLLMVVGAELLTITRLREAAAQRRLARVTARNLTS
ncbi:MAG TPA: hypothetical protein VFA11_15370 [Acidimicrobiales bacterium]|nr:hypothetical protein [Acidimicrobiales bacterium]